MPILSIPETYQSLLSLRETEKAIRSIKEFFQTNLAFELNLQRVTAPLFVLSGTGINDDLNGIERAVKFPVKALGDTQAEIVHSLAKWKRVTLADHKFAVHEGLYTDMNAIRADEELDALHSLYVDQWDWEMVIREHDRNIRFLESTVRKIYDVIRRTELFIAHQYTAITPFLPDTITFVHAEELETRYPDMSPKEREYEACREFGAVFLIGIGHPLVNGKPHDGRAPDYDDWCTPGDNGTHGLNGDILVYYPILDCVVELSSMGIRVDRAALIRQLTMSDQLERSTLSFHRRLLNNELPCTIGGGIGQSRLCMLYLRKKHIGEVQSSIWTENIVQECKEQGIPLL